MGYITHSYKRYTVRPTTALTNSYVAATIDGTDGLPEETLNFNQLVLEIILALDTLTSAEVKVEFSEDKVTWYQETFSSISSGTDTLSLGEHKMSASGNFIIDVPLLNRYVRISAKGTGAVGASTMSIKAILGNT